MRLGHLCLTAVAEFVARAAPLAIAGAVQRQELLSGKVVQPDDLACSDIPSVRHAAQVRVHHVKEMLALVFVFRIGIYDQVLVLPVGA